MARDRTIKAEPGLTDQPTQVLQDVLGLAAAKAAALHQLLKAAADSKETPRLVCNRPGWAQIRARQAAINELLDGCHEALEGHARLLELKELCARK